jgi:hypothetical protein
LSAYATLTGFTAPLRPSQGRPQKTRPTLGFVPQPLCGCFSGARTAYCHEGSNVETPVVGRNPRNEAEKGIRAESPFYKGFETAFEARIDWPLRSLMFVLPKKQETERLISRILLESIL